MEDLFSWSVCSKVVQSEENIYVKGSCFLITVDLLWLLNYCGDWNMAEMWFVNNYLSEMASSNPNWK